MKINIIYCDNSVGITADVKIMQRELISHEVNMHNAYLQQPAPKADANIFIQGFDFETYKNFDCAPRNILIPNQEWLNSFEVELVSKCTHVWCKTKYAKEKLLHRNKNCIITGFTSFDMYDEKIAKKKQFLHFKGLSAQKNTELVVKAFTKNRYPLIICDPNDKVKVQEENIKIYTNYLTREQKIKDMNESFVHLCPSLMEAWGHYVYEGLSVGATVILPDAHIYDEITNKDIAVFLPAVKKLDENILFSSSESLKTYPLRESYFINEKSFETICHLLYESEPRFNSLARQYFLENDFWFKKRIQEAIKNL